MTFFTELEQTLQKFIGDHKRPRIAKVIMRSKNQAGGITFPHVRQYDEATVIKTVWSWYHNTHTDQWNRIENTEINSDSYSQLICDKGGKNIKWEKDSFQQVMLGKLDSHMQIHKLAHTLTPCTRINSKWFKDLNIRHHQTPGREVRQNIL